MTVTREECARGAAFKVWEVEARREEFIRRGINSPEQLATHIDQVLQRADTKYLEVAQQRVVWMNEAERLVGIINPTQPDRSTVIPSSTPEEPFGAWIRQEEKRGVSDVEPKPGPPPPQYEPAPTPEINAALAERPAQEPATEPAPPLVPTEADRQRAELDKLLAQIETRNEAIRRAHEEALARERDHHRGRER